VKTRLEMTTDYDIFDLHELNRNIKNKVERLKESMRQHGFIPSYPLHVTPVGGGRFKVKGGHHRLEAAMALGIPVYYVVSTDIASIYELEAASSPWDTQDYVTSYRRQGIPDYVELYKFCEWTEINASQAAAMMRGQLASSVRNVAESLKTGRFKIKERQHANIVGEIVQLMKAKGVIGYKNANLVNAISRIVMVPQFDMKRMQKKIKTFSSMIGRRSTVKDYVQMLEDVYNYKDSNKVPLLFMADEVAKSRNVAEAKKAAKKVAPPTEVFVLA